jgi:DNA-binding response OmpR family regulator
MDAKGKQDKTILIVDDKASLTQMLSEYLGHEGYRVVVADNGRNALYTARHHQPNLILLDLMMPQMDGFGFIRQYRQEALIPIIVLSAKLDKNSAIESLKLGADDYLTKPFDLDELSARIVAVLRRYALGPGIPQVLRYQSLEIDPALRLVRQDGVIVNLTKSEFDLFYHLMQHPGRICSREELLKHIDGGAGSESTERTVDVHIRKLRSKLEHDPSNPQLIETVFGLGYRLRLLL